MENNVKTNSADSDLKIIDIFFSKIECYQNKNLDDLGRMDLSVNYHVDIKPYKNENSKEIFLSVLVKEPSDRLIVNVVANGMFELSGNLSEINKNDFFKYNAVAIMLPYVRSQISIITAQPGLQPVMLQPINVMKLWEKMDL